MKSETRCSTHQQHRKPPPPKQQRRFVGASPRQPLITAFKGGGLPPRRLCSVPFSSVTKGSSPTPSTEAGKRSEENFSQTLQEQFQITAVDGGGVQSLLIQMLHVHRPGAKPTEVNSGVCFGHRSAGHRGSSIMFLLDLQQTWLSPSP